MRARKPKWPLTRDKLKPIAIGDKTRTWSRSRKTHSNQGPFIALKPMGCLSELMAFFSPGSALPLRNLCLARNALMKIGISLEASRYRQTNYWISKRRRVIYLRFLANAGIRYATMAISNRVPNIISTHAARRKFKKAVRITIKGSRLLYPMQLGRKWALGKKLAKFP